MVKIYTSKPFKKKSNTDFDNKNLFQQSTNS